MVAIKKDSTEKQLALFDQAITVLHQQNATIEEMKKAIELALLLVVASSEPPRKETDDFIQAATNALKEYENLEDD